MCLKLQNQNQSHQNTFIASGIIQQVTNCAPTVRTWLKEKPTQECILGDILAKEKQKKGGVEQLHTGVLVRKTLGNCTRQKSESY